MAKTDPHRSEAMRRRSREERAQRKAQGEVRVDVFLPQEIVEAIDALQMRHDLRNRSQALRLMLEYVLAHPNDNKGLGL